MKFINAHVDELMSLCKPMDHEDLLEKILDGLRSEYQYVIDAVNGHDTPISFDELHEKLINKEIKLQQHSLSFVVPTTTNPTVPYSRSGYHGTPHHRPLFPLGPTIPTFSSSRGGRLTSRPFLGRCQWCSVQGHIVMHCSLFRQSHPNVQPTSTPRASP